MPKGRRFSFGGPSSIEHSPEQLLRKFRLFPLIDDLHERAGSRRVVHMHGELLKARCVACGTVSPCETDLSSGTPCPACAKRGRMRPHVVWFGEMPLFMDEIFAALEEADLFAAIGTSGSVYPAAGFVAQARRHGISTCEINLEPSDNAHIFDEAHYGPASEAVPAWTGRVLSARASGAG